MKPAASTSESRCPVCGHTPQGSEPALDELSLDQLWAQLEHSARQCRQIAERINSLIHSNLENIP